MLIKKISLVHTKRFLWFVQQNNFRGSYKKISVVHTKQFPWYLYVFLILLNFNLKICGMSFSDKVFMTKIQRPRFFCLLEIFYSIIGIREKNYFAGIYLFHTKNGRPGGQSDGIFLGPCLVCPMSMGFGMPGPRVLGVILWFP